MATKPSKAPARVRRSKAEVQQEFENIREEVESERKSANPKIDEATRSREAEIQASVEGVTVEAVVQRISGLSVDISRSLSDISTKLVQEVNSLAAVRDAVALERKELERLHKIDVAATALDQLVEDYSRRKQELESEITGRRAAWEEEIRTTERDRKEQEESLRKQRQRENEDFEYKKGLERKKAQDKYEEDVRLQEKKNQERQETLEKSWKQREAELKQREEELSRLRKEAEDFPRRLQSEAQAAAAEANRLAETRFEQQVLVLKKDAEIERRVAELQVKSHEDTVSRQAAQIAAIESNWRKRSSRFRISP